MIDRKYLDKKYGESQYYEASFYFGDIIIGYCISFLPGYPRYFKVYNKDYSRESRISMDKPEYYGDDNTYILNDKEKKRLMEILLDGFWVSIISGMNRDHQEYAQTKDWTPIPESLPIPDYSLLK